MAKTMSLLSRLARILSSRHSENTKRRRIEKLNELEREFLDPLRSIQETEPPAGRRRVLWALLILLLLALVWSWFSRIDVAATANGRFIPDGRNKVVQNMELSAIEEVLVEVGQRVEAGQLLVRLDETLAAASNESIEKAARLNMARQHRLKSSLSGNAPNSHQADEIYSLNQDIWKTEEARHASLRKTMNSSIREVQAELRSSESRLHRQLERQELVDQRTESARRLAEIGAIARNEYIMLREDSIALQSDIDSSREKIKILRERLVNAHEALEQIEAERRLDLLASLERAISESYQLTEQQSHTVHALESRNLHAPVAGTVKSINVSTPGEVVTAGSSIIEIVPDEAPLLVELELSDRDSGFVRVGQHVEIKVEAFPFTQYGVLPGKLVWISADAQASGQEGYYRAWVEPTKHYLERGNERVTVRPGMTASVDVNTGERRILEFFLSPLSRNISEGISVR